MQSSTPILMLLAAVALLSGCSGKEEVAAEITPSSESASLFSGGAHVSSEAASVTVKFHSAQAWSVRMEETKAAPFWLSSSAAGGAGGDGEIVLSVRRNPSLESRSTVVSLVSGEVTKSLTVTQDGRAAIPVTAVTLDVSKVEVTKGLGFWLTATVAPASADNADLSWSSSDESVATVTDGYVQAVASGEALITVMAGSHEASCQVVVTHPVRSVVLDRTSADLLKGERLQLTATATPADADDLTQVWSSSDESVATVVDGLVTAVSAGDAAVTVTVGGQSATCRVHVASRPVESLVLSETVVSVMKGKTFVLTVSVLPADADYAGFTWSSSDEAIVTVEGGTLTALALGEADITVTAGGKSASCHVTVVPNPDDYSTGEDLGGEEVDPWNA